MEPIVLSPKAGDSPGKVDSPKSSKHVIDTAAPIESVKDAVSRFGGKVEWRGRRSQSMEKSKLEGQDFGKPDPSEELENTKKLIAELKVKLGKIEREEGEAKEEVELISLKIEEMEHDIINEASIEAKAQFEVEKVKRDVAVSDLEFVKRELDSLYKKYDSLVSGRDIAVKKAEDVVAASKLVEKEMEELTAEFNATKESLYSSRATCLDAEEQRLGVVDEETRDLKVEFEQVEEEFGRLEQQVSSARVLESKLNASSSLLIHLKGELAAYMESKIEAEGDEERKKELEEVKMNIEKATAEVNSFREASASLKSKLELEKSVLTNLKQSEEKASAAVATLEEELEKTKFAIAFLKMKEEEARDMMIELPKKLQQAARDADEAKSLARAAQRELVEAQKEAEQAKARASTLERRLLATKMEIEAARASGKLAKESMKALEKSESTISNDDTNSSDMVTITLDEYHELGKRSYKVEEQANARVAASNSQIQMAKESELRSLEKLEELNQELAVRRESLNIAIENAEKARQGKLALEEELRTWIEEQEQQRNDSTNAAAAAATTTEPTHDLISSKGKAPLNNTETGSAPDTKSKKKKKKKSLFPSKVVMFFAKRKTHPTK
ncbi:PREDICTED: protein WEAK CHLOROPLAST MOVEMENT UNDER BLUE LIGHT 1-like [Lupinus angustifolius]|uniref:protein WEAK CHLOROPLAST MOVEMENT UNDER BLUE LIGHT 1-like n=1 Tax=Lupinus angustifolius TaxID=3871 RepID=UPI00092EDE7C|nr:PREDICTED: protein WEAK CHLOROPLAST MOVEMENT UNDER BLUE LIGHT 1-like [Lupinus angustifolius]